MSYLNRVKKRLPTIYRVVYVGVVVVCVVAVSTAFRTHLTTKELLEKTELELISAEEEIGTISARLQSEQELTATLETNIKDMSLETEELKQQVSKLQQEVEKLNKTKQQLTRQVAELTPKKSTTVSRGSSGRLVAGRTYNMVGTAYTNHEPGMDGKGITASGTRTKQGRTVAVDRNLIPLGTRLHITSESYPSINGTYIAEDVGGAIKGYKIDIFLESNSEMYRFGVRKDLKVTILD